MAQTSTRSYERSIALHREACGLLPGGANSNFRLNGSPVPLFFERGKGSHIYDVDGNSYVDYVLGNGPAILGHAPDAVVRAVAASLANGQTFAGQHPAEIALARRFLEIVPCAELVRFGSSGSEMVQAALRAARGATGRRIVVKFEGHYHGWLDNIFVSVTPPLDQAGPDDQPAPCLGSKGQAASVAADVAVLPFGDLAAVRRHLAARAGETAAIILEPIGCNAGVILPRPGFLEGLRELCDRSGAVLIFDEVITGFRVGLKGAQGRFGVTPDLGIFAKALGAGFPIAALAGRAKIMEPLGGAVMHGGTYNTNLVATSAAIAALAELTRDGGAVYRQIEDRGTRLMEGLRALGRRAGLPFNVQGVGAIFHTSFSDRPVTSYRSLVRQADPGKLRQFVDALQEFGVRANRRGVWFFSAAHTDADVDETLAAAERALAVVADGAR